MENKVYGWFLNGCCFIHGEIICNWDKYKDLSPQELDKLNNELVEKMVNGED